MGFVTKITSQEIEHMECIAFPGPRSCTQLHSQISKHPRHRPRLNTRQGMTAGPSTSLMRNSTILRTARNCVCVPNAEYLFAHSGTPRLEIIAAAFSRSKAFSVRMPDSMSIQKGRSRHAVAASRMRGNSSSKTSGPKPPA